MALSHGDSRFLTAALPLSDEVWDLIVLPLGLPPPGSCDRCVRARLVKTYLTCQLQGTWPQKSLGESRESIPEESATSLTEFEPARGDLKQLLKTEDLVVDSLLPFTKQRLAISTACD